MDYQFIGWFWRIFEGINIHVSGFVASFGPQALGDVVVEVATTIPESELVASNEKSGTIFSLKSIFIPEP